MIYNMTNETSRKGLEVFYSDTSGEYRVKTSEDEIISFYDDNEGKGFNELKEFIKKYKV